MRLSGKLIYNKHKKPQVVLHDLRFTFLVREMGLEPTRQRHTHLKRACLPIPALSHILCRLSFSTTDYVIISQQYSFVKGFCKISQKNFCASKIIKIWGLVQEKYCKFYVYIV